MLDYLSVAEVIETMEDLVQFVRDLSPCLSKVTREVEKRVEDLTHQACPSLFSPTLRNRTILAPVWGISVWDLDLMDPYHFGRSES